MALRDQPYIPLYVQDFLTDEKLVYCSASATGVYIRLMCIMHKSEEYGKILLKQNFKQGVKQVKNFASQLAVQMPYGLLEIENAIIELVNEKVLHIDGDYLFQKRMVRDCELSEKRATAGRAGGRKTQSKTTNSKEKDSKVASKFAKAKSEANTEYENEYEIEYIDSKDKGGVGEKEKPKRFSFKNELISYGFEKELVEDWLVIRKAKKAVNSERAFKNFITEVEKTTYDINEIMKLIIFKQWRGFEAIWLEKELNKKNNADKGNNKGVDTLEWYAQFAAEAFAEK